MEIGSLRVAVGMDSAQFQAGVGRVQAGSRRLQGEFSAMDAAAARAGSAVGRMGGAGLTNVAFQVQDFAVQVGAGTSATQALAQQLPQLLSGFGLLGAVVGTAAAVIIPLAGYFLRAGEAAEDAGGAMDTFRESSGVLRGTLDLLGTSLDDLREKYGAAAETIRANAIAGLPADAAQTARDALAAIQGQRAGLQNVLDVMGRIEAMEESIARARAQGDDPARLQMRIDLLASYEEDARNLAGALGLLPEQVQELGAALDEVDLEGNFAAAQGEAQDVLDLINRLYPDMSKVAEPVNVIRTAMEEIVSTTAEAVTQTGNLVDPLTEAANVAARYANELERAAGAISLAQGGLNRTAAMRGMGDGSANFGSDVYANAFASRAGTPQGANEAALVAAVVSAAERSGYDPAIMLALMGVESGWNPGAIGGAGGNYQGLIQFGPQERSDFGVSASSSIAEQVVAAVEFLKQRGVRPGDPASRYYAAVLAGNANAVNAGDTGNGGRVGNVSQFVRGEEWAQWYERGQGLLQAYGGTVQEVTAAEETLSDTLRAGADARADFIADQERARSAVDAIAGSLSDEAGRALDYANAERQVAEAIRLGSMSASEGAALLERFQAAQDAEASKEQADALARVQGELDGVVGGLSEAARMNLEFAEAERALTAAVEAGLISTAEKQQILNDLTMQQAMGTEAMQDTIAAQEQAAQEWEGIWSSATDNIVDFVTSGFEGGFDRLLEIGRSVLDDLIAYYRANPVPVQADGGGGFGNVLGGPWGGLIGAGVGIIASLFGRRRREREARERREREERRQQEQYEFDERTGITQRIHQLTGNTKQLREMELGSTAEANREHLKRVYLLEDEQERLAEVARVADERLGIQVRLLELQGNTASLRRLELAELDPANRALMERVYLLEDEQERLAEVARVTGERRDLEQRLMEAEGDVIGMRVRELAALDPANRALLRRIWAVEDATAAEEKAAEATARIADERQGLHRRFLEALGRTEELRRLELATLDPANRALQERVWAIEDWQAVQEERRGLEERLLELQGNTAELRRRELEALDPANRSLQIMIWGLEDAKDAMDALDMSDFASRFDFERMRASAANRAGAPFPNGIPLATVPNTAPVAVSSDPQLLAEFKAMREEQRQIGLLVEQHTQTLARLARKDDTIGTPPVRAA